MWLQQSGHFRHYEDRSEATDEVIQKMNISITLCIIVCYVFLDCFVTSSLAMTSVPKLHIKFNIRQPFKMKYFFFWIALLCSQRRDTF